MVEVIVIFSTERYIPNGIQFQKFKLLLTQQ